MKEFPEKLNNQAILLASDGNFTEAIACFKRALTIQNNNYLLWYNLGVTYRDAGELEKAKHALETAYKIAPENEDISETYATICLNLGKYEKVQEICFQGLELSPCNSKLWNLLGVTEFQQKNYQRASENFEHAVYINPYYLDALYNLRDTYTMLHNKNGETECENMIRDIEGKHEK